MYIFPDGIYSKDKKITIHILVFKSHSIVLLAV